MKKRLAFAYHPDYLLHTPPFEHPESPERLTAITDRLRTAGLLDRMLPITPDYAEEEDVLAVHGREYLDKLETACRAATTLGRRTPT
jgi:acetoin utilization deacetylase AcuC-like enzyme